MREFRGVGCGCRSSRPSAAGISVPLCVRCAVQRQPHLLVHHGHVPARVCVEVGRFLAREPRQAAHNERCVRATVACNRCSGVVRGLRVLLLASGAIFARALCLVQHAALLLSAQSRTRPPTGSFCPPSVRCPALNLKCRGLPAACPAFPRPLSTRCCDCVLLLFWCAADPSENDGRLQMETRDVGRAPCTYLKFTIATGWFDFVTVHSVIVEGTKS